MAWQARNDDRHGHDAATRQTAAARQAVREIQHNLGLQQVKHQKLLNIFVTKKHEDSHVEFSTISTVFSFLIVTTNNKSLKIQLLSLKKQVNQVLSQHHCH